MRYGQTILRAFLHGFTGAGLFRRLDYPGAPKEFVDSRSLEEIHLSGDYDRYLTAALEHQRRSS
jgi:hypothetical protein